MLKTGPDGALWVADMYRYVIEHPEWIPDDWEKRLDLRAGSERGTDLPGLSRRPQAPADPPAGPARDTRSRGRARQPERLAARHRRAAAHAPPRPCGDRAPAQPWPSRPSTPRRACRPIWTLAVLDGLDQEAALAGLNDPVAEVRESVIAAAEPLLARSDKVADAVLALAADEDPHVRLKLALALGNWNDHRAGQALARLATNFRQGPVDARGHLELGRAARGDAPGQPARRERSERGRPPAGVDRAALGRGRIAARTGLDRGARSFDRRSRAGRGGATPRGSSLRSRACSMPATGLECRSTRNSTSTRRSPSSGTPPGGSSPTIPAPTPNAWRPSASWATWPRATPPIATSIAGLLRPRVPVELQQGAVAALAKTADAKVPDLLVRDWKKHTPQVRTAILDALMSRPAWTGIAPLVARGRLRRCRPRSTRRGGSGCSPAAIARSRPGPRPSSPTRPSLARPSSTPTAPRSTSKGNRTAGAVVFKKLCASCHRLGSEGIDVGPDLAALRDKSPEALLIAILDPNRAFEARYANFTIGTTDGRTLTGLIASESATSVTLRRQDGKEDVLLRSQIEEMTASGQSLMPEGLEKDLKPADLADLIAYLVSAAPAQPPR